MLFVLLYNILCAMACYGLGVPKGYGGTLCAVAGFFGGIIAIIIVALLPDREEDAANTALRDSTRDREIAELKKRIAQLETMQPQTAQPREDTQRKNAPPSGHNDALSPVTFPARTEENITCPHCGRKQKGNRNACYSCGTPFRYENE